MHSLENLNVGIKIAASEIPNPDTYLSLRLGHYLYECRFDILAFDQQQIWYWCREDSPQATMCNTTNGQDTSSVALTIINRNNMCIYIDLLSITTTDLPSEISAFSIDFFNLPDHINQTVDTVELCNGSMSVSINDDVLNDPMQNVAIVTKPERETCSGNVI